MASAPINTAAPEFEVSRVSKAKGWDHYFLFVETQRQNWKNIRQTLNFWCFDESAILFYGDTINDSKAAAEAKVEFVGIGKRENFLRTFRKRISGISRFSGSVEVCSFSFGFLYLVVRLNEGRHIETFLCIQ